MLRAARPSTSFASLRPSVDGLHGSKADRCRSIESANDRAIQYLHKNSRMSCTTATMARMANHPASVLNRAFRFFCVVLKQAVTKPQTTSPLKTARKICHINPYPSMRHPHSPKTLASALSHRRFIGATFGPAARASPFKSAWAWTVLSRGIHPSSGTLSAATASNALREWIESGNAGPPLRSGAI